MRRILFVFHVSSVGGGSYCLYNLLKAIDRTVFEPVVLLPGYGSLCDEISKLDIRIEYIGPVIGAHCGPGTLAVTFLGRKERPI